MSEVDQPALLDLGTEASDERGLFYLTNRMNLNAILASRLVAPRESFGKYYTDLLESSPSWVPLLGQPPGSDLIDLVTSERGSGTPVLIEFARESCSSGIASGGAVYVRGLQLAEARAIHFPDERSAREHRARVYGNVHPHEELLRVTPELFSGDQNPVGIAPPESAPEISWRRVDRVRGALNAAVAYAAQRGDVEMAQVVLGTRSEESAAAPPWLSWNGINDIAPRESRSQDGVDPDAVTFDAIYNVLEDFDIASTWVPSSVIDRVRERIDQGLLREDDRDLVLRNLQRVRQLVEAEVDFEPFRPTSTGLTSAKALILVLLRPDLSELLGWPIEETGADDVTVLTAAILAGRLRGLSRESAGIRSIAFDDVTAAWAVRAADDPSASLARIDIVWDGARIAVVADSGLAAEEPPAAREGAEGAESPLVTAYNDLGARSKVAARLRVARKLGWPITTVVKVPRDAQVISETGSFEIVAVDAVKLAESISEDQFLAHAKGMSLDLVESALAALRPRGR